MPAGVGYGRPQFVQLVNDKRLDPQVPSKPKRIAPEKNAGLKRQHGQKLTAFNRERKPTGKSVRDGHSVSVTRMINKK